MTHEIHCPLCNEAQAWEYARDQRRPYLCCGHCGLVLVAAEHYLDRAAERAEYALHQNDPADPGYRAFLSRFAEPLVQRLSPGAEGLDFGCGPGPALAQMLGASGFRVALYDSFFAPDRSLLERQYDFICATEVVEHLHHPGRELAYLWSWLNAGGWLGIMTKLVRDQTAFATWHYKNDPTHVCFFSQRTWQWWAERHVARLEFVGADVILLRRCA